jgi:predicted kinase
MKKVIILRGIPGSGKSTWAQEQAENRDDVFICSSDQFFDSLGRFDPRLLPEAHARCLQRFIMLLTDPRPRTVIVDNTNTRKWEFAHYELVAKALGAKVEVMAFEPRDLQELRTFAYRNVHEVPLEIIGRMFLEFDE